MMFGRDLLNVYSTSCQNIPSPGGASGHKTKEKTGVRERERERGKGKEMSRVVIAVITAQPE